MSAQGIRQEKPPRLNSGGLRRLLRCWSAFYRIGALSILSPCGRYGQTHLLSDRARQEPAHGMGLPARRFHQLFGSYPARPLKQGENRLGLAALPHALLLGSFFRGAAFGFGGRFGRFLRRAGLLARLALLLRNVRALWLNTGLFGGFRLLSRRWGLGGAGFFCNRCVHVLSFCGDHRGHDMDHSGWPGKQGNSGGRRRWFGND
jgi:hypothetical protein